MCGIAGVVSKDKVNRDLFEKMTDLVSHRGPDDRGTWYDDHVALGHRRLSILDLSEAGHQPFIYQDRYILTYNGEIYNYIELRDELKEHGMIFNSRCDTEVLVAAYACWGEKCVDHFNGMWAFALYDIVEGKLFCSRDRYGVKPFYYAETDKGFIFGSEIKQILYMTDGMRSPNRLKLMAYLLYGTIDTSEETLFEGIVQLMPGESLTVDVDKLNVRKYKYYDIAEHISNEKRTYRYGRAKKEFLKCYEDAVRLRLRSDVRVGYCLSGGLDSSANVCVAKKIAPSITPETVTYCSAYPEYDEQEYADEVIERVSAVSYKTSSDAGDVLADIDRFLWHNDEPFGSSSIHAGWSVFKETKARDLTVMIDGQGADEQLMGYIDYLPVYYIYLLKKHRFIRYIVEVICYYAKRLKSRTYWSKDDIIIKPLKAAFGSEETVRSMSVESIADIEQSPFTAEQIQELYGADYRNPFRDPDDYLKDGFTGLLALLHCEDRMTMAHSIESRLPFLDYRLVDMLGQMPVSYKIRNGMTKAVMRDSLKGILPDKVRTRLSKFGFVTPEAQWINSNIDLFDAEMEKSVTLLSENGILDKDRTMKWWEAQRGNVKRGYRIPWRIICAAHWMKVFELNS